MAVGSVAVAAAGVVAVGMAVAAAEVTVAAVNVVGMTVAVSGEVVSAGEVGVAVVREDLTDRKPHLPG